ncbi:hypothetical protein NQ314_005253 [Rhamnusium bicolor]|uniref:Uncharacterized protein n=1 Tax=Rhamnusium bicolor TaxID=1586634 RepID=A0AAV8ZHT8_9CUCU|nr:hypothetical protein NQ314_005253 [Rhamnusium bicolor]
MEYERQTNQPEYQPSQYPYGKTTTFTQSNIHEPVKTTVKSKKPEKPAKSKHVATKKLEHKSTCKKSSSSKPALDPKVSDEGDRLPPLMTGDGSQVGRCCCEAGSCVKNLKELLDKEMEYRQTQVN